MHSNPNSDPLDDSAMLGKLLSLSPTVMGMINNPKDCHTDSVRSMWSISQGQKRSGPRMRAEAHQTYVHI